MPLRTGKTPQSAFRVAVVCLALFVIVISVWAQQAGGRVVDRSGRPVAGCQLDFYVAGNQVPVYRVFTNRDGSFALNSPRPGNYTVSIRQGQLQSSTAVAVQGNTLRPSVLVANW